MVDGRKPGVGSRDDGKHTGRNDLLLTPPAVLTSKCGLFSVFVLDSLSLTTFEMADGVAEHAIYVIGIADKTHSEFTTSGDTYL